MDFYPSSEITIGNYRFSGVNEVNVKRSMNTLSDTATIKLPGRCVIQQGTRQEDGHVKAMPGNELDKNAGMLFAPGDKVTIKLGWNGALHEEFRGFVHRVGRGMPVDIECEGYVKQLRDKVTVSGVLTETTAKKLLEIAIGKTDVKGKVLPKKLTDINLVCDVDVPLKNVELDTVNGLEVCDLVRSLTDNNLSVFFLTPDLLWCGYVFTSCAEGKDPIGVGTAGYRPGWNAIRDKDLKQRIVDVPVQVSYGRKYADDNAPTWVEGKVKGKARKEKKLLAHVAEKELLRKLAVEKEYRSNYEGYEGKLKGFLEPYCQPGYKATIVNKLYPELDGDYLVLETEVRFGLSGARRDVTTGPRVG